MIHPGETGRSPGAARPAEAPPKSAIESANLDLLRSVAVLFVVAFHLLLLFGFTTPVTRDGHGATRWDQLGHWGVLMFFVHTSLVLMQSLDRSSRRPGRSGLFVEFMVRRCFRLLPLSVLTVVVVVLFRLPVGHLHRGEFWAAPTRPVDVLANLLLVQNLTHVESVEAPLWSLPFEMQMYLVLPAIFAFVRRRSARHAYALWIAALLLCLAWERRPVLEMPAYVPCFLAGVVAFRLARPARPWPRILWPAALAVVSLVYLIHPTLRAGWLCCLALGTLIPQFAEMPEGPVRHACRLIARYSYGVYLSHFIVLWFAFAAIAPMPWAVRVAVLVVLLVAVPVGLYHWVEAPMIRLGGRVVERLHLGAWRVALLPTVLATGCALAVLVLVRTAAAKHSLVLGLEPAARPGAGCVRLVGRFDRRDRAGPRFAWPGSTLDFTFEGRGIDVVLDDGGANFFTVVVDGRPATAFATMAGAHAYPLASRLPQGRHEVVLTKRTESSFGVTQYLGITSPDVNLVDPEPAPSPARRIEFVGDSIACGYGVLGESAACSFSAETEDETRGYAALAAADLGAEATLVAYSGKGMLRDYQGNTAEQMPVLFERTLPEDPSSVWSFVPPAPDVVVIELGTNDFDPGDPGPPFERAYTAFLATLRGHYPKAYVVCTLSPMLLDASSGPRLRSAAAAATRRAVDERHAMGDARVAYLAFDPQDPRDGYGCDAHPSARTHRRMATQLADAIRAATGW